MSVVPLAMFCIVWGARDGQILAALRWREKLCTSWFAKVQGGVSTESLTLSKKRIVGWLRKWRSLHVFCRHKLTEDMLQRGKGDYNNKRFPDSVTAAEAEWPGLPNRVKQNWCSSTISTLQSMVSTLQKNFAKLDGTTCTSAGGQNCTKQNKQQ